jgi:hypothetical protein
MPKRNTDASDRKTRLEKLRERSHEKQQVIRDFDQIVRIEQALDDRAFLGAVHRRVYRYEWDGANMAWLVDHLHAECGYSAADLLDRTPHELTEMLRAVSVKQAASTQTRPNSKQVGRPKRTLTPTDKEILRLHQSGITDRYEIATTVDVKTDYVNKLLDMIYRRDVRANSKDDRTTK